MNYSSNYSCYKFVEKKKIKKKLTNEEIEALKQAYKMLDLNSDGILTKKEFQAVLNYNNQNLKSNEADMQLFVLWFHKKNE